MLEDKEKFPYREWLFDDALHSSRGAYRCMIRYGPEDANLKTYDYAICDYKDGCETCPHIGRGNAPTRT